MIIQNGAEYKSNYARAAAYFISTCAPAPEGEARLAAYRLITGLYALAYDDAAALGWKPLPDASFAPFEQQKGREKDIKSIRDAIAKIEALAKELFDLAEAGQAQEDGLLLPEGSPAPKRALTKALAALGYAFEDGGRRLSLPRGCAMALKELCAISREHIIPITDGPKEDKAFLYFSRCVFDPHDNWTAKAFDSLLGANGLLIDLCGELEKRSYQRIDCRDGKKISLDYVKQHGKKAEPVKMAWGERTHSGIEVSFEELRMEPCFVWLRMPMFKTVLAQAERLPATVLDFILNWTKTCDGCRYCVQTDKTGTRPLAAVKLNGKNKCPLYPGFTMNWRALTPELCGSLLSVLDALNELPLG